MVLESDFTKRGGGGAESQVRTLGQHLMRLGQRVTVLTPLLARGPQITAERCYGIPVGRLRYPRWRVLGGGIMCLRFALFLWEKRDHYDAWHVHIAHHLGAVACVLGAALDKPVVVKLSGFWELEKGLMAPSSRVLGAIERACFRRASALQAISTRIAAELERQGFPRGRIVVLPNAVNTAKFCCRTEPRRGVFTAVFVGRLVPEKDLSTLLDAWALAFPNPSDARLLIVGGGVLEANLRAQAEQLKIQGQVEFWGHRDRVEEVLAEADVGVLPSRIEGLSNTLLEFMACGLPVIATRISGSEDFVNPGDNGWLFPVGDTRALADCLQRASAMDREVLHRFGLSARLTVERKAALEAIVPRLLELYRGHRDPELPANRTARSADPAE